VIAFRDDASSDYGTARVGNISGGTVITFGSEYLFSTDPSYIYHGFGIALMSETRFVVGYTSSNLENMGIGRVAIGNLSSSTISFSYQMEINPGFLSRMPAVCGQINTESFVVCWADDSYSNWGKCRFYGGALLYLPLVRK